MRESERGYTDGYDDEDDDEDDDDDDQEPSATEVRRRVCRHMFVSVGLCGFGAVFLVLNLLADNLAVAVLMCVGLGFSFYNLVQWVRLYWSLAPRRTPCLVCGNVVEHIGATAECPACGCPVTRHDPQQ